MSETEHLVGNNTGQHVILAINLLGSDIINHCYWILNLIL